MKLLADALRLVVFMIGMALCCAAGAAPPLQLPEIPLGTAGERVPANVLINYSVTYEDAGAAFAGEYDAATTYDGYFNPLLCYTYPDAPAAADAGKGYFSPLGVSDARHACVTSFSGNFMNWATATRLDLLRFGLTGGDRVIDEPALTVLQRAWLPDPRFHPQFHAAPSDFPRKMVAGDVAKSVTPFAGSAVYVHACDNRVLFSASEKSPGCQGTASGETAAPPAEKNLGEFMVRVAVCDALDSRGRPDLCRAYGDHFKPEGSMQRAGTSARVGVMSYLTEQKADEVEQYAGVLRAPLKFLGPANRDAPRFQSIPNARREWDAETGVLLPNPDGADGPASGAINYLNQLGRSNDARRGAYASSDPGAELYYEALRYLQGRGSGVSTTAQDDAFPVWQQRADPVTASCQRNVIATIGHTAFVDDRFVPGNTRTDRGDKARAADSFAPGTAFDVMQATRRVGDMEQLAGLDARDDGPDGAGSFYLAGAAYWANTHPVRPDQAVTVGSSALELGTPAVPGVSALYLAAKYGGFTDLNADADPFVTAGGRRDNSEWSADGKVPRHYHAAGDPHAIVGAARALLTGAGAPAGLVPGALAAGALDKGKGFLIQTAYDAASWNGTVQRRALSLGAGGELSVGADAEWDAALLLDGVAGGSPPRSPASRNIFTMAYGPGKSSSTIAFDWDRLSPALQALLDVPAQGLAPDGMGKARVAFLRGERSLESGQDGGMLRRRASALGDPVRSVPLLVGAPSTAVQDEGYADFFKHRAGRPAMVYVGANDGMLHGFDSASGAERFAYIPNALLPALSLLSSPAYQHRPYVDASAGAGEAFVSGSWRTVLASGMGMGARGVFALDISDPAAFAGGLGALWEFTDQDDPAMGYVHSPPLIAKLRAAKGKGSAQYRYFVIVASGINPAIEDGSGALFLLSLDKPASQPWQRGVNYHRFSVPSGDASLPNALAPPVLALAGDGSVRHAYAGDLQGSLWRFDFTGDAPWSGVLGNSKSGQPLFSASDAQGKRQPIMHAPRIVFAPGGGYVVLFGTGKFLEESDLLADSFTDQSFYAVHDRLGKSKGGTINRAGLLPRVASGTAQLTISGARGELYEPDGKLGWYLDFPQSLSDGERIAASATVSGGTVMFDTLLPGGDPCTPASTRNYVLDALRGFAFDGQGFARNGERTGFLFPGVTNTPPVLLAFGGESGPRNATGGAKVARQLAVLRVQDGNAAPVQQIRVHFQAKRLSWREVANWQDLHDAAKR